MDTIQRDCAELAAEYWKLLRAFERAARIAPEAARARLLAQVRYADERLSTISARLGMRVVSFDGVKFEVNLPATAVNAEDIGSDRDSTVERTLEPAIISENSVILSGKVFLTETKVED